MVTDRLYIHSGTCTSLTSSCPLPDVRVWMTVMVFMWRVNVGSGISMLRWSSETVLLPYQWNGWAVCRKIYGSFVLWEVTCDHCRRCDHCVSVQLEWMFLWSHEPMVKAGGQLDPVGISWAKMVHAENGQGYGPVVPRNVSHSVWLSHSWGVGSHDYVQWNLGSWI
jgi:hypothetical protein